MSSTTRYLNVKNGIEILHSNGLTQILAGDIDPSSGDGLFAEIGSIFLSSYENGTIYSKSTSANTGWTAVNSSALTIDDYLRLFDRDKYLEYTYNDNGEVSSYTEWLDDTKTYTISHVVINRTSGFVTSTEKQLFDYLTGTTVIATVTGTITRDLNNYVQSISYSS